MELKNLTQLERMQLHTLSHSPGYEVLLDLMEAEREKACTELLRANPADEKAVLAAHNTARAFAVFIERIQKAITYEVNEGIAEQEAPQTFQPTQTEEEIY